MPVFGVICEYDPFHLGHRWMLEQLHRQGPVVCAMSGCFTQRGEFAAVNKFARAEMAVRNGADLVLELPTPWAVSGAERFARGGVELLEKTGLVTHLAFGSECGDLEALQRVEAASPPRAFRRPSGGDWRAARPLPATARRRWRSCWTPGTRRCCPSPTTSWPSSI